MQKYHYVYRITNAIENKHYYGVRSSKVEPKLDLGIKYFSSSTDKMFKLDLIKNTKNYKFKVIKTFKTRKEAINLEIKLHNLFNVGINESFYNKSKQTSLGFDTTGKTAVKDKNGNTLLVNIDDQRFLNGEFISVTKDKLKNVPISDEHKLKITTALTGKPKSKQHIENRIITVTKPQDDGKNIMQEAAQKAIKTKQNYPANHPNNMINIGKRISAKLNEIGVSGMTISKERSIKQQEKMKINSNADSEYFNKINAKRITTGNTILPSGKTIFEEAALKSAITMKTTIQENGKTIEENRHIKANITKHDKAEKFNVFHIVNGLQYSNLTAMEVYSISASLINKTKENWLGKNSNSLRARLINRNESYKLDLYVERVV